VQIAILGPLEARIGDAVRPIAGFRLRALLIRLALDAGRPVGVAALLDAVWGDDLPVEAANALQSLISRLRRGLGDPGLVVAVPAGYRLDIAADEVDVVRFERDATRGGQALRAGDPDAAATQLSTALALWRGPALVDVADEPFAAPTIARLEDLRLSARIDWLEAERRLGRGEQTVAELEPLVLEHPLHERLAGQLVTALAAAGRTAEALAAYDRTRAHLAEELGIDPSTELQELQLAVLRGQLTSSLPSAVPPAPRRTNLPAQLTSFVGREQEVERIGKLLDQNRLVTVVGPGGGGKTRLASEAAGRLIDTARDGVWFVPLASVTDGADVASAVVGALGLRDTVVLERTSPLTVQDATTRLVDSLGEDDMILVLDNCEHVLDAAALLSDQLLANCPRLRILATSREPLGMTGEALIVIPPLDQPGGPEVTVVDALDYAAVRLFADRAGAVQADFVVDAESLPAVLRIVRRLDGLPLAIELAAARLRAMPVQEVAERLSDRFRLLTGGSRTALPRHRTLAAVVAWSWELLTGPERLLAERLAVFPGGATLATVEQVCAGPGLPRSDIADLLGSLVEKSLLQRRDSRFVMLETIREYGAERLAERAELAAVRGAHARVYLHFCREADAHLRRADQLVWLARLEAERDNILAALRFLIDTGQAQAAIGMATALAWYWTMIGSNAEGGEWLDAALALDIPSQDVDVAELSDGRVLAEAMRAVNATGLLTTTDDSDFVGWQDTVSAMAIRLSQIDPIRAPLAPLLGSVMFLLTQQDERARELIDQAVENDDPWISSAGRMVRANIAENVGDVATMRTEAELALAGFRALGERWGQANSLQSLGQIATMDSRLDDAIDNYTAALALIGEMHSRDDEAMLRLRLADLRMRNGDPDGARDELSRAVERGLASNFPPQELFMVTALAEVARLVGDLPEARRLHREAARQLERIPTIHPMRGHGVAISAAVLARICLADNDITGARENLELAYQAGIGTRDQPVMATVGIAVAEFARSCGQDELAAEFLGCSARLRGAEDPTNLDIKRLAGQLQAALGSDGYAAAYERGRALPSEAALARLDPSQV
jgi:predicted ATPase/DNA-binding SARP family transcriptional activator